MSDLFPELGPLPQAWEVWDSASGNLLLSTPDRDEALGEAAGVWRAYGDAALGSLSVGCEPDGTVYRGQELRGLLTDGGWLDPAAKPIAEPVTLPEGSPHSGPYRSR